MANFSDERVISVQEERGEVDYFDLLPDPILLLIFNKLLDAKSLCRCILVSKRFASLVSQVDSISIEMDNNRPKIEKPRENSLKLRSGSKNSLKNFVSKFITKPLQFLQHMIINKKFNSRSNTASSVDILNWVGTTLKNFNEIQSLKLKLPCPGGEIGMNKTIPLLKWEAGFGKEMERCVILGANSIVERKERVEEENEEDSEPIFSDDELKLRIIWILSCLISSSARHNLVKKMVNECPKLSNAVISDAGKQGKLSMNEGQIRDLRDSIKNAITNDNKDDDDDNNNNNQSSMGYAGNLVMKLWYVKELELPNSGQIMKGATLVVIKPEGKVGGEGRKKESDGLSLWGAFEGEEVFEEAANELLRRKEKKVYRLEMNSF